VLVVDDEPDVEVLFRQRFRREVREGDAQSTCIVRGGRT
jgi:hypothetical protein